MRCPKEDQGELLEAPWENTRLVEDTPKIIAAMQQGARNSLSHGTPLESIVGGVRNFSDRSASRSTERASE